MMLKGMEIASLEPSPTSSMETRVFMQMSETQLYHTLSSVVRGITNPDLCIPWVVPILIRYLVLRYEPFMSKKYNLYLKHMSATGGGGVCSWGDHLTLDAIANMYNIRVWCIESPLSHECTRIGPLRELSSTQDIYVGHIGEWHYVSVAPSKVYWLSRVFLLLLHFILIFWLLYEGQQGQESLFNTS